jgi:hypothetical protein
MPPWKPLTDAGILQFIDKIRSIFISRDSFNKRMYTLGNAFAGFFKDSFVYLRRTFGAHLHNEPRPSSDIIRPAGNTSSDYDEPKKKKTVRRSARASMYANEELGQVRDEYLQCIEENSVPVFADMGMETAQAITKNRSAATICKLNMMKTYSNLMYNRV